MRSEALKKAQAKYAKEKTKRQTLEFYPTELDVWEYLRSKPNKAGYIKDLIRKDMQK